MVDLKCLCQCSLVSKHLASLISRVRTVSITLAGSVINDKETLNRLYKFMSKLWDSNAEQLHALVNSLSLQTMKLPNFLDKLTELECINLDYSYSGRKCKFPSLMCKIKFHCNGAKFESFVALVPLYMHKDTKNKTSEEVETRYKYNTAAIDIATDCVWQVYVRYLEWICLMFMLIKCHPSLKRVTITDSEIHGKLVVGDEQGVNLERGVLDLLNHFYDPTVRSGSVPMLHLPLSGYVMRGVAVVIVVFPENPGARAKSLDEMEFWDFDDELPVFREAVEEFLKKHKEKLRILRR